MVCGEAGKFRQAYDVGANEDEDRQGSPEFGDDPGVIDKCEGRVGTQRGGSACGCDADLGLTRPTSLRSDPAAGTWPPRDAAVCINGRFEEAEARLWRSR